MFQHIPSHGIQFALISVCHMGMGIIMQEYDAISEFTWMLVFALGMQFLKRFSFICM
jgi:hypothetical protein